MASSAPDVSGQAQGAAPPAWRPSVSTRRAGAAATPRAVWQVVAGQATGMWAASRVVLLVLTYCGVLFGFAATGTQTHLNGAAPHAGHSLGALLMTWYRWDALHFVHIATTGYSLPQETAFFPLYPIQIRLFMLALGNAHPVAAAMLAANVDALLAFIALGLLAAFELGQSAVRSVVLAAAAYPLAFFMAAAYSDALFLALATFAVYAARRGNWWWAAGCALLAGLTRPTGVVLILPLVWEFGRQHGWWRGRWRALLQPPVLARLAVLAGAAPFGIFLYATYLGLRFGHPLLFVHVQGRYWERVGMPLWQSLPLAAAGFLGAPGGSYDQARLLVDVAPLVLFALLTLLTIRRMPAAFTLYMAGLLYVCVATPMLDTVLHDPDIYISSGRFLLAAFPMFLLLGRWMRERPWLETLVLGVGFSVQAVLLAFFLAGGWLV